MVVRPAAGGARFLSRSKGTRESRQVVLKIQFISDKEGKQLVLVKWVALALALALLIWELTVKLKEVRGEVLVSRHIDEDPRYLIRRDSLQQVSVPIAAACVAACLAALLLLARRLWWVRSSGKLWTPRQRLSVSFTAFSLLLQTANAGLWLASMAFTWAKDCSWFYTAPTVMGGLQWSIWNLLFTLNIWQASQLLPTGAWEALFESLHLRLPCASKGGREQAQQAQQAQQSEGGNEEEGSAAGGKLGLDPKAVDGGTSEEEMGSSRKIAGQSYDSWAAAAALGISASVKETVVQWGVRLAAFGFLWVPTQVIIILITTDILQASGSTEQWDGFLCDPLASGTFDISCMPTGNYRCDDLDNPACYPVCTEWEWDCSPNETVTALTKALGAMMNLAALVFLLFMWLALHQLGRRPYYEYRVQNLAARLALRTRVPAYLIFVLTMVVVWYIRLGTCTSYIETWLGLGPMQIMMTATCVWEMLLFMPSARPDHGALLLHGSLQQFAWTEREVGPMLQERGFPEEPLFCFETALKAAYYALHVYRHFNPQSTVTSISSALALSGCTHFEWLREPTHDSNCLLMWGRSSLVVAFRGTASVANIKADLKAWRTAHKPKRGSFWAGTMPLVHLGFAQSWECDGFNAKVLARIRDILQGCAHAGMEAVDRAVDGCCGHANEEAKAAVFGATAAAAAGGKPAPGAEAAAAAAAAVAAAAAARAGTAGCAEEGRDCSATADLSGQETPFRILLAGHSLGGAMTHLCGIDLARALPGWGFRVVPAGVAVDTTEEQGRARPAVSLSTYTFGAPRTGNRAFARDYGAAVPDCWSVINGQDAVANQAKFLVLFKRPGKPVLLSRRGDLIVRPFTIEHTAHRTLGTSLKQHMLFGSYCPSLAAVLRAQVGGKPMPGGCEALEHLQEEEAMRQLLEGMLGLAGSSSSTDGSTDGRHVIEAELAGEVAQQPSGLVG